MSFPCGSNGPFFVLDRNIRDEVAAHRDRVFAALSRHSDPAMRELGRLLARGIVTLEDPKRLQQIPPEELRRQTFGPIVPFNGTDTAAHVAGDGPCEANPASRADSADPDNGAGGVPAIRR